MLPTLENSERFKKDYNQFRERIAKVTNERVKSECNDLLTSLLKEVRTVDNHHQDIFLSKQLPNNVEDTRNKITEIRKSLHRRLEDYERSVLGQA